jgi:hypothetical protein
VHTELLMFIACVVQTARLVDIDFFLCGSRARDINDNTVCPAWMVPVTAETGAQHPCLEYHAGSSLVDFAAVGVNMQIRPPCLVAARDGRADVERHNNKNYAVLTRSWLYFA